MEDDYGSNVHAGLEKKVSALWNVRFGEVLLWGIP